MTIGTEVIRSSCRRGLLIRIGLTTMVGGLYVTGCSDAGRGGASDAVALRDSAGVSIIHNAEPEWAAGHEWRLGEADLWVGAGAASDVMFTRISDLVTLPDGVIAVANEVDPAQILLLGNDGESVGTIGRTGEGPGEFGSVERLWFLAPDTLLAYDAGRALLHRFTVGGQYIDATRVNRYAPPGGTGLPLSAIRGRFQDGTVLFAPFLMLPHPNTAGARGRDSVPVARATEAGEIIDTIGVFPTIDYMRLSTGMVTTPVWQKESTILASENSLFVGMGDTFTIEEYGLDGTLLRRILRSGVEPRSPASLREDYIAAAEEFYGSSGPGNVRRTIEERFVGEELPAYGKDWLIDGEGHLWVPEYVPTFPGVAPAGETEWSVFDPSGRWLGQVRMPSNFQPKEIGGNHVLGVWRDEFQVQSVRRFRLVR